ncbi:hypothetical protein [Streptomyces violaceusniger]|uniref:hypothetical protein n=1 Tax=Streptomyces violaceusniger TaxID=68280 RepID=UPI0020304058|nr:hypothetical protein [Streptomyces violaceusniger]
MRTSVTTAAPQLAAAGLGIAVCPVSAVSDGFPGAVRPFSPRWIRQLVAVTSGEPDPLVARFIGNLRSHGVRVPRGVRAQLAEGGSSAGGSSAGGSSAGTPGAVLLTLAARPTPAGEFSSGKKVPRLPPQLILTCCLAGRTGCGGRRGVRCRGRSRSGRRSSSAAPPGPRTPG